MSAAVDAWILGRRPAREPRDAYLPYEYFVEEECAAGGGVEPVATVFLTNKECPFRCVMCDLWRNTLTETVPLGAIPAQIDHALLDMLAAQGLPNELAALHSESPGLMIDRLSILALKIFHTREEMERRDAPVGHAERNAERMAILTTQRADLAACLATLWDEVLAGTRQFKVYRQLKMYNDPALNPAVYRNAANPVGS